MEHFTPDYSVVGSDFNFAFDNNLDRRGTHSNNNNSAKWVQHCIDSGGFVDIFRHLCPDSNGFTWYSGCNKPSFSRLDYFLISETCIQFVDRVLVHPSFKSDHSLLEMILYFGTFKRGPGH